MKAKIGNRTITLVSGDITTQSVDAIVNAANSGLLGGGGVDGAIHDAAGPELMAQLRSRYPAGCPTGSAVITDGGGLDCRYVIHAVGPVWKGGREGEAEALTGAYRTSLQLAQQHKCRSVAFPAISAGAFGYPMSAAADVALATICDFPQDDTLLTDVRMVLYFDDAYQHFIAAMQRCSDLKVDGT